MQSRQDSLTPGVDPARPTPRPSQQTVFSRLQALFPSSPPHSPLVDAHDDSIPPRVPPLKNAPKFLKIRIVTWNMHESLPKGDLEDLLGNVPPYKPDPSLDENSGIPVFSSDAGHPYHILVIAGQECPSTSGLPMGLNFRLRDKEKERDKEKGKEADKDKDKDLEKPHHNHVIHNPRRNTKDSDHMKDPVNNLLSPDKADEIVVDQPSGWTSILEHWYCHRSQASAVDMEESSSKENFMSPKRISLHRRITLKEQEKGPYVPLIKDRLMGLYLSIFVHRDVKHLVNGSSKSFVTAGLIGGRVGNKGGVGISLDIAGTTFLFLNAHLAAHEGRVHHRLANLAKIKGELAVADFLKADDERVMAEDVTDKFDFTFLFGDLNFRLDITRLHADWLISRQDYAQAFAFDQLREQMNKGTAFAGFQEASINFPPTFKYDVVGRSKSKASRRLSKRSLAEKDMIESEAAKETGAEDDENEEDNDNDVRSLTSSLRTSTASKAALHDADEDDYFTNLSSSPALSGINERSGAALTAAARKAKTKWKSLISSPVAPKTPTKWLRVRQEFMRSQPFIISEQPPSANTSGDLGSLQGRSFELLSVSAQASEGNLLAPPGPRPVSSGPSSVKSAPQRLNEGNAKGVYDSSHKQRVPSWCDRILWKSTVHPDPEDIEVPSADPTRPNRLAAIWSQFASRVRRNSVDGMSPVVAVEGGESPRLKTSTESPRRTSLTATATKPAITRPVRRSRSSDSLEKEESLAQTKLERRLSAPRITSPPSAIREQSLPTPMTLATAAPARWRFFSFRKETSQAANPERSPTPTSVQRPPAKGDVVCLSYDTLDDRGMRKLQGRSDHRPVIGSYAVYI